MKEIAERIEKSIKNYVESSRVDGVVIGVSGGLDSAVVLKLCLNALGKNQVTAIYLPCGTANERLILEELGEHFDIDIKGVNIDGIYDEVLRSIDLGIGIPMNDLAMMNTKARIRMVMLYAIANSRNLLVVGTSNKSELMTGYFTKYGDGGVDFEPIGDLYKTEVFELAKHLEVLEEIINLKPSAGLYEGQTDEDELGMNYKILDEILYFLEKGATTQEVLLMKRIKDEITEDQVNKVRDMMDRSWHKHQIPVPFKRG